MSPNLTKRDLTHLLSQGSTLSKKDVDRFLSFLIEEIMIALKNGRTVQIIPFGTFKPHHRKARRGKNPRTNETLMIEPCQTVLFRPGKFLRNGLS